MPTRPSKRLQTFANPSPRRDYRICMEIPEFTCLCPMTGQPDFATLSLEYIPDRLCVELKSLKLYVWSYRKRRRLPRGGDQPDPRGSGARDPPALHAPGGEIQYPGGISTSVVAEHCKRGWKPQV